MKFAKIIKKSNEKSQLATIIFNIEENEYDGIISDRDNQEIHFSSALKECALDMLNELPKSNEKLDFAKIFEVGDGCQVVFQKSFCHENKRHVILLHTHIGSNYLVKTVVANDEKDQTNMYESFGIFTAKRFYLNMKNRVT